MTMASVVALENAVMGFGSRVLLKDISLSIEKGQWVSVIGPNGSGKTTLLRALLGLHPLSQGRLKADSSLKRGFVPQRFTAPRDTPVTVSEFLAMGAAEAVPEWRAGLTQDLGIASLLNMPLNALSSGQLQAALLAFALWDKPELLFLDEYLEGLDPEVHSRTTGYLENLHSKSGLTVIEVSHDISSVVHTASRVVVINRKIAYDGAPGGHGFHDCLHHVYGHHHWVQHGEGH